jgi:hypothetical protein
MSKLLKSTLTQAESFWSARSREISMIVPAVPVVKPFPESGRPGIAVVFRSEREGVVPMRWRKATRIEFDPRPPVRWGINE